METDDRSPLTQPEQEVDTREPIYEDFLSNAKIPLIIGLICLCTVVLAVFGLLMLLFILPVASAALVALLLGMGSYPKASRTGSSQGASPSRDRTLTAGIISITCVMVVAVMMVLGSSLLLMALPLGIFAGAFGVYTGIRERRAMVLLPAVGAVITIVFCMSAYDRYAAVYREQFAPDLRAEAAEVAVRLSEYVRTHDGQLPRPEYLADALGKDLNNKRGLAGIRGPKGFGWLAINRNVLGRNIRELPTGTVLVFECNPRIGLYGRPVYDTARNTILPEHVLIVTLQDSSYSEPNGPPRLSPEIQFVPESQLSRYIWDPQRANE